MKLKWHETCIWLYSSEDLLLAAFAEWVWHKSHAQVYCLNKLRYHLDKQYKTYLNVYEKYCWYTSEMRWVHCINWRAWLDTQIIQIECERQWKLHLLLWFKDDWMQRWYQAW